ncbi:ABC transporter permease [Bombilactobacillus bombi]|uniref:ABC transporter permease n=1 Tax=Bombilactobacillus bombi TaxID=1303590 RepID=UPI0015E61E84|nr:ABC transporter permease [Bombilactobacillus bombi]MBA1434765.1 lantibiotic ABC transporter permease [Bombilactobacillus bombi]
MIIHEIKTELLKEKRSANSKLLIIVPIIFALFSLVMNLLMGPSPNGRSNFVAAAFNWYPLMILPSIISLFVCNIINKEYSHHIILNKMCDYKLINFYLSKCFVVVIETAIIILISSVLTFIICKLLGQYILLSQLLMASLALLIGSIPIMLISFILKYVFNNIFVIIINFIAGLAASIVSTSKLWILYPWSLNLRFMASILKIHPNGTFLKSTDKLAQVINTPNILVISVLDCLFLLIFYIYIINLKKDKSE